MKYDSLDPYIPSQCVKRYGVIQSECGKMRTRITPNMDTFYPVSILQNQTLSSCKYMSNNMIGATALQRHASNVFYNM